MLQRLWSIPQSAMMFISEDIPVGGLLSVEIEVDSVVLFAYALKRLSPGVEAPQMKAL